MMMFLQLALLTLFIASPSSLINAENVITCGKNVQRLSCAYGVIKVQTAFYGRTSSAICRVAHAPHQHANTRCSSRITAIATRCNGKRVCEFNGKMVGNFDPCPGTAKYFSTTYTCVNRRSTRPWNGWCRPRIASFNPTPKKHRTTTICDNSYKTLSCGSNTIKILRAVYGRSDRATCVRGIASCYTKNTKCAANVQHRVASECNGRTTCTVFSSKANFYDPCPMTAKYLKVSYTCSIRKEALACEHKNVLLTCGLRRTIRVLSANYGRTDSSTCSSGRFFFQVMNTRCYQRHSVHRVMNRCNGKRSCLVPASNAFFSDPCYGTFKYLRVSYACK